MAEVEKSGVDWFAKGAADQPRSAVADEGRDHRLRQRRTAEVVQRGVDGGAEIGSGINQRAIEVEYQQAE